MCALAQIHSLVFISLLLFRGFFASSHKLSLSLALSLYKCSHWIFFFCVFIANLFLLLCVCVLSAFLSVLFPQTIAFSPCHQWLSGVFVLILLRLLLLFFNVVFLCSLLLFYVTLLRLHYCWWCWGCCCSCFIFLSLKTVCLHTQRHRPGAHTHIHRQTDNHISRLSLNSSFEHYQLHSSSTLGIAVKFLYTGTP